MERVQTCTCQQRRRRPRVWVSARPSTPGTQELHSLEIDGALCGRAANCTRGKPCAHLWLHLALMLSRALLPPERSPETSSTLPPYATAANEATIMQVFMLVCGVECERQAGEHVFELELDSRKSFRRCIDGTKLGAPSARRSSLCNGVLKRSSSRTRETPKLPPTQHAPSAARPSRPRRRARAATDREERGVIRGSRCTPTESDGFVPVAHRAARASL